MVAFAKSCTIAIGLGYESTNTPANNLAVWLKERTTAYCKQGCCARTLHMHCSADS